MNHQQSQTLKGPKVEKKVRIMTTESQLFNLPISEVGELEESNDGEKYSCQFGSMSEPCAFPELKKELDNNLYIYEGCAPADADASMYKQLDRWKKDHMLLNSKNANEIKVLRDKHKSSLQNEGDFPKVNTEILNSILRIPSEADDNYKRLSNGSKANHARSQQDNLSHSSTNSSMINSSLRTINLLRKQHSTVFDPSIRNHNDKTDQGKKADTASLFKDSITQDARQRLVNRKLVNNLIFTRVTKTYGEGEAISDKSQISNQSTSSKAESLFKDEIDKFSKHTLANFKQLLHTFEKSKHLIDYEGIRQKLMVFVRQTPSILINENNKNKTHDDEYMTSKRDKELRYHFKMTEQALLTNYSQISHEIEKKQAKIQSARRITHDLRIQIKQLEQEQRERIERAEKEIAQKSLQMKSTPVGKSKVLIQEFSSYNLQNNNNINRSTPEADQKAQAAFQQKKEQIEREVAQQETLINQDEKDIKMSKQKREITRSLLKELYVSYLKDNQHSHTQSLVLIAKSLLGVDIDLVASSELFPSILDKTSIRFLSEYAALDNTLDKLQEKLKNVGVNNGNKSTHEANKQDEFDRNYIASQHAQRIFDVKNKIKKIAMSDMLKVRRPVFVASPGKSPQLTFEEIHQGREVENITFSLSKVPVQKQNQIRQNQTAREEIAQIQARQQAIKEAEVNRLFEAGLSAKESKSISEIKAVLVALLGDSEAEEQLKVYRQISASKLAFAEKNKTFTFSRQTLCTKKHQEDHKDQPNSSKLFLIEQPPMVIAKRQQQQQQQHGASDSKPSKASPEEAYFPGQQSQQATAQRNQTAQFLSVPAPMLQKMREVKEKTYLLDSRRDSNVNSTSFNLLSSTSRNSQYFTPNKYMTYRSQQSSSEASDNSTFNLTAQEITPSSRQRNSQHSFYSPRHYSKQ